MIDYKKLKKAHELAQSLSTHFIVHAVGGKYLNSCHEFTLSCWKQDEDTRCRDLDDLIEKLEVIAAHESKYKVGDAVWRLNDECYPERFRVVDIDFAAEEMYLDGNGDWWVEEQLFPSRKALIEAQLDHWKNLLSEELEQHVSDYCSPPFEGEVKGFNDCDHGSCEEGDLRKCFKCGELYR